MYWPKLHPTVHHDNHSYDFDSKSKSEIAKQMTARAVTVTVSDSNCRLLLPSSNRLMTNHTTKLCMKKKRHVVSFQQSTYYKKYSSQIDTNNCDSNDSLILRFLHRRSLVLSLPFQISLTTNAMLSHLRRCGIEIISYMLKWRCG